MSATKTKLRSLKPTQELVETEDGEWFVVMEASSDAVVNYRNATTNAARMVDGKLSGWEGLHDAEPLLVAACVYKADEDGKLTPDRDGKARPVGITKVKSWPYEVTKFFFDKIKELTPKLTDKPTVEGIDKQIQALQKQRETLLQEEGAGSGKATTSTTGDISG